MPTRIKTIFKSTVLLQYLAFTCSLYADHSSNGESSRKTLVSLLLENFNQEDTLVILKQHPKLNAEVAKTIMHEIDKRQKNKGIIYRDKKKLSLFTMLASIRIGFRKDQ